MADRGAKGAGGVGATSELKQRLLFVLATQMGMKYRDIGQVVDRSEDAVKVRVRADKMGVETASVKMSMNPFCEIAM